MGSQHEKKYATILKLRDMNLFDIAIGRSEFEFYASTIATTNAIMAVSYGLYYMVPVIFLAVVFVKKILEAKDAKILYPKPKKIHTSGPKEEYIMMCNLHNVDPKVLYRELEDTAKYYKIKIGKPYKDL